MKHNLVEVYLIQYLRHRYAKKIICHLFAVQISLDIQYFIWQPCDSSGHCAVQPGINDCFLLIVKPFTMSVLRCDFIRSLLH